MTPSRATERPRILPSAAAISITPGESQGTSRLRGVSTPRPLGRTPSPSGWLQSRRPVASATATTIAVFLPVALVGDITGELFRPFALTTAIALAASLFVSLTIGPVLSYWFLRAPGAKKAPRGRRAAREDAGAEAPAPAEAATEAAAGLLVGAEAVQAEEGGQPGKVGAAASFATSNCGGAATAS